MYEFALTPRAKAQLSKLPREARIRVYRALDRVRFRPLEYFVRLTGDRAYKLRVGDYRVIADISSDTIVILKVSHRKNVYEI